MADVGREFAFLYQVIVTAIRQQRPFHGDFFAMKEPMMQLGESLKKSVGSTIWRMNARFCGLGRRDCR